MAEQSSALQSYQEIIFFQERKRKLKLKFNLSSWKKRRIKQLKSQTVTYPQCLVTLIFFILCHIPHSFVLCLFCVFTFCFCLRQNFLSFPHSLDIKPLQHSFVRICSFNKKTYEDSAIEDTRGIVSAHGDSLSPHLFSPAFYFLSP